MINAKDLREISSSLNVLYVEDEAILRDNMETTFKKLFANVYIAKNGQEAFEIFKKEEIDLLVTDINMPIMDGIELIQTIHKHTDKEVLITVLSAHDESKLLIRLINLGIDSFLNKPVDKQFLINSLYKSCKLIHDRKLLVQYEVQLQSELEIMDRKNEVLQQKLNQFAIQTNKNIKDDVRKKEIISAAIDDNYYENLLQDDKEELRDLHHDLENFIAMLFQSDSLNENYLIRLSTVYKKYAAILNSYPEFFDIAESLSKFSETLLLLESKFMADLRQTGIFFESLQLTLGSYMQNIWNKQAENPRFYNASLIVDIQCIIDYLEGKEIEEGEMEFF